MALMVLTLQIGATLTIIYVNYYIFTDVQQHGHLDFFQPTFVLYELI